MTVGSARAVHRTRLAVEPSAAFVKSYPPVPGEGFGGVGIEFASAIGALEAGAFLDEGVIAAQIFPGEARPVE